MKTRRSDGQSEVQDGVRRRCAEELSKIKQISQNNDGSWGESKIEVQSCMQSEILYLYVIILYDHSHLVVFALTEEGK